MRVTIVTAGLEHLGVEALSAFLKARGHEVAHVYEPKPFSSNSGPDNARLARWLEPPPSRTAARVAETRPDLVAFSSYTITHRWSVEVARAVKRELAAPVVFGGPHVSGAPEHAMREPCIDAVVEGEGEGALADLVESVERRRLGRVDVPNAWVRRGDDVVRNPLRPLIEDLDALPFADKSIYYREMPGFEREFYVIARRGCPYRCSFCEYSLFPSQYPGERSVRRRSVRHLIEELRRWRARGRMRKVFFWDAIFTLDPRWIDEFADAYARDIAVPFECYTHPLALSEPVARALARAGCAMLRVGVQTVNDDTLAALDRRGDRARVAALVEVARGHGIPVSVDHILGLPGEGAADQEAAARFYNDLRPRRVIVHWMTFLPGTTALDRAERDGLLTAEQVERVRLGEQTEGFETPRVADPAARAELDEMQSLEAVFDLLPLLPRTLVRRMLDGGWHRRLPRGIALRQAAALALSLVDGATRARMLTLLESALRGALPEVARRRADAPDVDLRPPATSRDPRRLRVTTSP